MANFISKLTQNPKDDLFAGITVSLAMVPEVVAFAFVAGIDPIVALSGAFMVGIIAAIFGGRPGLITGAAGAVAVIFIGMIATGHEMGEPGQNLGFYYLFACVIMMGLIQILAGVFKIGRFVRLIPHPVMMGFVNGLAIVIFLAQLEMFKHKETLMVEDKMVTNEVPMEWWEIFMMLGLIAATIIIMKVIPLITKKIPAALTAIVIVAGAVIAFKIPTLNIGQYINEGFLPGEGTGLNGQLPQFETKTWSYLFSSWDKSIETLAFITPFAFLAASVGLIESLMTMNLVDEITDTKGRGNKECVGQGLGNIVSGLFGGTGGCGMIGQTLINIDAKGRGKLSGIVMALTLLSFILFASSLIELVPIAALVGVMFVMVFETFAWSSFRILGKIPKSDAFVLIAVSAITVFADLAIAVFVGIIISALVFAWKNALRIRARKTILEDGTKLYELMGPLFFGSIQAFNEKFDVKNDPENVQIDFLDSKVSDHSSIEAIQQLVEKYKKVNKKVHLIHLSPDCKKILLKNDPEMESIIEENIDDPRYYVLSDEALIPKS